MYKDYVIFTGPSTHHNNYSLKIYSELTINKLKGCVNDTNVNAERKECLLPHATLLLRLLDSLEWQEMNPQYFRQHQGKFRIQEEASPYPFYQLQLGIVVGVPSSL
uniref:Uncharacterized protein n=1 Tax=Manihot esculenta TaxID=3983 RepID=A0A2C9VT62_MANES